MPLAPLSQRLAVAALLLFVAGCDTTDTLAVVDVESSVAVTSEAQLVAAKTAWVASGVDDYEYAYDLRCFCAPGERVTVRNGRAVRTTRRDLADAQTIDDLFDQALDQFRAAATSERYAAEVRLSADVPQIPVLIAAGPTDPGIADGDVRLVVTGFEVR